MAEKKQSRKVDEGKLKEMTRLTSVQEVVSDVFSKMRGRIFNVVEVSIESTKVESMKTIMRDITGEAWNEISTLVLDIMQNNSESREE